MKKKALKFKIVFHFSKENSNTAMHRMASNEPTQFKILGNECYHYIVMAHLFAFG